MLDEASAFLDLFARSGWGSCHVRTSAMEIFVARTPGAVNPMAEGGGGAEAAPSPPAAAAVLAAPHLGTLASLAQSGEPIAAGDTYAVLDLLGEPIALVAERAGKVVDRLATPGTLVEFDQPLLALG